uniref:CSON007645 protein n=1 Tax=Culicoides sonorensis TaxID=179676 RepID=A0A336N0M3_CULSO
MSLFKVCNWWTIKSSDISRSYDCASLHCTRLNILDNNEKDYVIIGSHNGLLCIYKPVFNQDDDEEQYASFAASDVLLETQLDAPILAIISGKFSTTGKNDTRNLLAVLHPMKLVIYAVVTTDGIAEHGNYSKLQIVQEHNLRSHAFTVCKGNFGGYKAREFLCVYHMDGSLKFFEQDGITFECKLPDERAIPSQLLYITRIDCFITVSPGLDLECFRYQDLIDSQQLNKKIVPIWTLCVGEGVLDMNVNQISNTESLIVLLGENNLICTSDTGKIRYIKRLDYTPICFCSFVIGWYWEPNARLMIAVVSDNGSLLIYDQLSLVWAAQLTSNFPVAIQRSNIQGLPGGAIVTLSDKGTVNVGYLGSDPHLFKAPPLDLQQLDFQKAHMELTELERQIQHGVDFINPKLDSCPFTTPNCVLIDNEIKKMVRLSIAIKPIIAFEQVQITIFVPPPFKSSIERFVFKEPIVDQTERLDTYIYMERSMDIPTLSVQIFFTCINKQNLVRVIERQISIPMELVFKLTHPQRDAKFKITLTLNEQQDVIKDFGSIFSGSLFTNENTATQAFGFKSIYTGNVVTVAIAKNSNRYRIQSDQVEAITPLLIHMLDKLKNASKSDKNGMKGFQKILITPPFIPIEIFVGLIQDHYRKREEFNNLLFEIDRRHAELRLFEARFAIKSQEENAKVNGIQFLIDLTNNKLTSLDKRGKIIQDDLQNTQIRLSSCVLLIKTMMHHIGLHTKTVTAISNALNQCVNDFLEQSWEESIFPALDMLEHVGPLHQQKDQTLVDYFSSVTSGQNLEFEFSKLIKYIENSLATVVQMSIKLGNSSENEKIDDFTGTDDDDTIHEEEARSLEREKSEWFNDKLPASAAILVGERLEKAEEGDKSDENDKIEQGKQEDKHVEFNISREPSPLHEINEENEPGIDDEFL